MLIGMYSVNAFCAVYFQLEYTHFKLAVIIFLYVVCIKCLFAVVPHITNAIQEWVERVSKVPVDGLDGEPDVCIVEVISHCWQTKF